MYEYKIRTIHNKQEFDETLALAEAEGWEELALLPLVEGMVELHLAMELFRLDNRTRCFILHAPLGDHVTKLKRLTKLRKLTLVRQDIDDQGAQSLSCLSSLSYLNLSGNLVSDHGAVALARMSSLSDLDLRRNNIGDDGAIALAKLRALRDLNLSRNQITNKGVIALANLANLANLALAGNQITDKGAVALAKLPLRLLSLHGISFGETGLHDMLDAFCDSPIGSALQLLRLPSDDTHATHLPRELLRSGDA